ncbi:MAG: twin-arginine translocase TatA/TatE family subunit [Candidatus Kapaibacterium sp.]|nr:twin-arginine translocase TatA/TatE family subunit [Candidatus Kapabacteria bacterium]
MNLLLFTMPGGMELILIVLLIVLLFGAKKIPELMKGLGSGIKEFKKASNIDDPELQTNTNQIDDKK